MTCNFLAPNVYYHQRRKMPRFLELYESYASDIYRFAFSLSGERAEAEDITSETFIRAWVNRSAIRTETLKAYLMAIARNTFLERQRKSRREVALEETLPDPAAGPEDRAESRLELARIEKLLRTVPEIDRAAFVLRVRHGLPYEEIARALEITLASAKVKVHRVRKRLLAACIERKVY
jgi:RNA polymerase sigma-70 factor, ECF subfamily